jgi:hypothetical protein
MSMLPVSTGAYSVTALTSEAARASDTYGAVARTPPNATASDTAPWRSASPVSSTQTSASLPSDGVAQRSG